MRQKLVLSIAFIVAVVGGYVAAVSFGGHARNKGIVVGLGDSVAAGYGLGPASGYPNNDRAYPEVLARTLEMRAYNFAISSACAAKSATGAAGTPGSCEQSVIDDELPMLARLGSTQPKVVTLTVGANDVRFAFCSAFLFSPVDIGIVDPCAEPGFTTRLGAFEQNLDRLLRAIRERFPRARIVLTSYYNPAPSPTDPPCPVYKPLVALQHPTSFSLRALLQADVGPAQQHAYEFAARVVSRIAEVQQRVATRYNATMVVLDVAGHDICRSRSGGVANDVWMFGPGLRATLPSGLATLASQWNYELPEHCPLPTIEPGPFSQSFPFGSLGSITLTFSLNCAPHPTAAGHEAIARAIARALT